MTFEQEIKAKEKELAALKKKYSQEIIAKEKADQEARLAELNIPGMVRMLEEMGFRYDPKEDIYSVKDHRSLLWYVTLPSNINQQIECKVFDDLNTPNPNLGSELEVEWEFFNSFEEFVTFFNRFSIDRYTCTINFTYTVLDVEEFADKLSEIVEDIYHRDLKSIQKIYPQVITVEKYNGN